MEKLEQITKNEDKKSIKDFFKPTLAELAFMLWETPLLSLPIAGLTYAITKNPVKSAVYATIPQAITYAGMRAYELLGRKESITELMKKQKVPFE